MSLKDWAFVGGILVAIVLATMGGETVREIAVGGASGPVKTERQYFLSGFESGGVAAAHSSTTVAGSFTFTATELQGKDYIELTPTVGALTATMMATTTGAFDGVLCREFGCSHTFTVYNATTTTGAASVITFAAGTGIDLQEDESGTVTLNGLETARITLVRKNDTDALMWVETGQVGD